VGAGERHDDADVAIATVKRARALLPATQAAMLARLALPETRARIEADVAYIDFIILFHNSI